jgi:D-lactate dehydrogenase (cytochrome)
MANRFSASRDVRAQHGEDLAWIEGAIPDGVAFVQTKEEVAWIVKTCAAHGLPVIPYGTGTSLEGHINATFGGVTIDFSGMNNILEVNAQDMDCVVEPGVTRKQLNKHLRDTGLFFPIDPGADASLGGMAATRASGTNSVRYGTMRENVINLTAVMADGRIITTARRARKTSAGYDLTRLLVGSEGTLGVICALTLRLQGIPEAIGGGVCGFKSLRGACDTAIETIQSGIPIARVEMLDDVQVRIVNHYSKLGLAEIPTLFVEFHGTEAGVREQAERFGEIAKDNGGEDFAWSSDHEKRNRLWRARHDAYMACLAYAPGRRGLVTDVCVPISNLAACVAETQKDVQKTELIAPIVGHVGDGNFHVSLMIDAKNAGEVERAKAFSHRLVERALAMEGTCTGEHGVGLGKVNYLKAEHGPGVEIMARIKRALDPKNILNPGKIVAV